MIPPSYFPKCYRACSRDRLRCREFLTQVEGNRTVGISEYVREFGKHLIANSGQLISSLRLFVNELITMPHEAFELSRSFCWGNGTMHHLQFVSDLHAQFELIVQLVR